MFADLLQLGEITCSKPGETINLQHVCWQVVSDLLSTSCCKPCEHIPISTCDRACCKMPTDLLQLLRFWLCIYSDFILVCAWPKCPLKLWCYFNCWLVNNYMPFLDWTMVQNMGLHSLQLAKNSCYEVGNDFEGLNFCAKPGKKNGLITESILCCIKWR